MLLLPLCVWVLCCIFALLCSFSVPYSFAIILPRKKVLILIFMSYCCVAVGVQFLFLAVTVQRIVLWYVIVVFPNHTRLLFDTNQA